MVNILEGFFSKFKETIDPQIENFQEELKAEEIGLGIILDKIMHLPDLSKNNNLSKLEIQEQAYISRVGDYLKNVEPKCEQVLGRKKIGEGIFIAYRTKYNDKPCTKYISTSYLSDYIPKK